MVFGEVMRSTWGLGPGDLHAPMSLVESGRRNLVELIPVVRYPGTVGWVFSA
jgi:hypothetical protein